MIDIKTQYSLSFINILCSSFIYPNTIHYIYLSYSLDTGNIQMLNSLLLSVSIKLADLRSCHRYYYLDDQSLTQGPFSRHQMKKWIEQNCFDSDLMIRCGDNATFIRLGNIATINNTPLQKIFETSLRDDIIDTLKELEELQYDLQKNSKTKTTKKNSPQSGHKRKSTWKLEFDKEHNTEYYFNPATGVSQWTKPEDF